MYLQKFKLNILRSLANNGICEDLGCKFLRYHKTNDYPRDKNAEYINTKHINGVEFKLFGDIIRIFPDPINWDNEGDNSNCRIEILKPNNYIDKTYCTITKSDFTNVEKLLFDYYFQN